MKHHKQRANEILTAQLYGVNEVVRDGCHVQAFSASDPDSYFNRSIQSGTVYGVEHILFLPQSVTYPDGHVGLIQTIILLDELANHFGSSKWHYKFTAWNEQSENVNKKTNKTYCFAQYKLKSAISQISYHEQEKFDVHLSLFSTIVELASETVQNLMRQFFYYCCVLTTVNFGNKIMYVQMLYGVE